MVISFAEFRASHARRHPQNECAAGGKSPLFCRFVRDNAIMKQRERLVGRGCIDECAVSKLSVKDGFMWFPTGR